jgi:hypothetical protein
VGRVWDCMMCTCVNEEGWDREGTGSEASSVLSYTLRYVRWAQCANLNHHLIVTEKKIKKPHVHLGQR